MSVSTHLRSEGRGPEIYTLAQIRHLMRIEFSRAQRHGYPLVCLMIGVDGLGPLRDRLGYDAKEIVMDGLVAVLDRETRTSDLIGRLPDDRFLVVVPHAKLERMQEVAERLLQAARSMRFETLGGEARISLSIGGSWLAQGETMFFDDLLQAAEDCLAGATAEGGDRYVARPPGALH